MGITSDTAELNFLIARLEWPVPSVRWWVMQELASLLLDKTLNTVVEQSLRARLSECKFETEVVEILQIFWLAKSKKPEIEIDVSIGDEIDARSLLSDLFILNLNPRTTRFGKSSASLMAVKGVCRAPSDLLAAESVHFPPILRTTMQRLATVSAAPLEEQFFHQWEASKSRVDFRWQLMTHFLEGRPGSATGQFYSELSARARSAFLRTLTIAHEHRWCPQGMLQDRALQTLPLDPSTAWLRSKEPPFQLPELSHSDDLSDPKRIIEQLLTQSGGGEQLLGGLSWPVFRSESQFIEIEIQLVWREGTMSGDVQPGKDIPDLMCGEGLQLGSKILYPKSNELMYRHSGCKPLIRQIFPSRCGYAQADLNIRGLYAPLPIDPTSVVTATPDRDVLKFHSGGHTFGYGGYWTANWRPCYPLGAKPRIGTYLMVEKTYLSQRSKVQEEEGKGEIYYHWKAKCFHKKNDFDSYESVQKEGIIPLSEITNL